MAGNMHRNTFNGILNRGVPNYSCIPRTEIEAPETNKKSIGQNEKPSTVSVPAQLLSMAQGAAVVCVNRVGQDCACVTSFCTFPVEKLAQTWQPVAPAHCPVPK